MAKLALKQRELKRDKLVAKFAAKRAELKAVSTDLSRAEEERAAARLALQKLPRNACLLYTSPSPRDKRQSRMPSSA